jgi:REP element-mobilizing transposase RayT
MAQSLSKVYLHIVFSTKNHIRYLNESGIQKELFSYTATILKAKECPAITVGGHIDHIHILCILSRTISIADLLRTIKRSSSKWLKTKHASLSDFQWQNGYSAFSVSQSGVDSVRRYINTQDEHHKKMSYKEELIRFFEKYQVSYDDRYVWD